jgi:hypothetical protein
VHAFQLALMRAVSVASVALNIFTASSIHVALRSLPNSHRHLDQATSGKRLPLARNLKLEHKTLQSNNLTDVLKTWPCNRFQRQLAAHLPGQAAAETPCTCPRAAASRGFPHDYSLRSAVAGGSGKPCDQRAAQLAAVSCAHLLQTSRPMVLPRLCNRAGCNVLCQGTL